MFHAQICARVNDIMSSPIFHVNKVNQINMRFRSFALSTLSIVTLIACGSTAAKKEAPIDSQNVPTDEPGSSDPVPGPSEKASDSGSDSSTVTVVDSGPHAPTNQAECIASCESNHPKAAALSHQLDATCYIAGPCEQFCNNVPPGKNYPPTADADAAAPVACQAQYGEGVDPIMTPSAACSTCLAETLTCCKLWVDIFGSVEGRDLNKCAVKCFTDFKN